MAGRAQPGEFPGVCPPVRKARAAAVDPGAAAAAPVGIGTHPVAADPTWVGRARSGVHFYTASVEERPDEQRREVGSCVAIVGVVGASFEDGPRSLAGGGPLGKNVPVSSGTWPRCGLSSLRVFDGCHLGPPGTGPLPDDSGVAAPSGDVPPTTKTRQCWAG